MERPGEESLIRYFLGKCDPEEQKIVRAYLALKIDADYVECCLREAFYLQEDGGDSTEDEQARERVWDSLVARQQEIPIIQLRPRIRWYAYAAAVALAILSVGVTFLLKSRRDFAQEQLAWQHIQGEAGHTTTVMLADSSTVTLFPGSTIDIPSNFNRADRRIKLNGRAFFNVAHNKEKPFYVSSDGLTTKVLGTSFEVNTMDSENIITLHTGQISVLRSDREIARLIPNQQIKYQQTTAKYSISSIDAASTLNWLHGELEYDRVPLRMIIRDMEKWYNVKIRVVQPLLLNQKVIFSFKDQSLNRVLNLLSKSANFSYEVNGKNILLKERNMETN
ncbi:FecR family protein [Sphingobacterium sp. BIGb0165]|uniref:FecR family protein n=1 Tax=Sphingobacterium sp. BIGb0165 TaxID=2940615 RepID=UPI0021681A7A|nr:FecR domain-containing protein [Sphingobacterium sp. BIGb0165]MCS4226973.1 ferric-dicitrate binding protein FerR (iron transport regulator) [Sphingobacterium sp. BIGb0165]